MLVFRLEPEQHGRRARTIRSGQLNGNCVWAQHFQVAEQRLLIVRNVRRAEYDKMRDQQLLGGDSFWCLSATDMYQLVVVLVLRYLSICLVFDRTNLPPVRVRIMPYGSGYMTSVGRWKETHTLLSIDTVLPGNVCEYVHLCFGLRHNSVELSELVARAYKEVAVNLYWLRHTTESHGLLSTRLQQGLVVEAASIGLFILRNVISRIGFYEYLKLGQYFESLGTGLDRIQNASVHGN